jgi:2,4-dienoyl-CoA reductase-like NADH-dependent reductase (Old Yellow Enzyme family)
MQLSHAGRQSPNVLGGRTPFVSPMAPSAVAVGSKAPDIFARALHYAVFQTPRPMSVVDVDDVVRAFVRGAEVAARAGFDGVQLHAAHGCA